MSAREYRERLGYIRKVYLADYGSHMKEILGRYLYRNGELDEKRCRDNQKVSDENYEKIDESRRLIGYPLEKLKVELETKSSLCAMRLKKEK